MSEPFVIKLAYCNNIDCAAITLKPDTTIVLHGISYLD